MKIVLATGIYPPAIGGPATYVKHLSEQLSKNHTVEVVTYGKESRVHSVSKSVPIVRWFLYAQKLKKIAKDADVVYCFSSVSTGVPLLLSGLKKPKKVLRLGGDFGWERYTDWGGKKSLSAWYADTHWSLQYWKPLMQWILVQFDHIVFSTEFQQKIYQDAYKRLPKNSVIENALPISNIQFPVSNHQSHTPFRLLFMGRFVHFKNIPMLIKAVKDLPDITLTIVGDGPKKSTVKRLTDRYDLGSRIRFVAPVSGNDKEEIFRKHDLLILPSLTDISPNTALEARAHGLPVLLTKETGIASDGIVLADLSDPQKIAQEISRVRDGYSLVAEAAAKKISGRSWKDVSRETEDLFATL